MALLFLAPAEAGEAYKLGVSLLEQRRAVEAIPQLRRAAELDPGNAQYWKALGVAFAATGDYRGSLEPFRRACALNEKLPDACYYSGRAYYAADRYREALAPLGKALHHDTLLARAEAAVGQCLEALGEDAEAEQRFLSALRRSDASRSIAGLAYGRFLVRRGRASEALPILEAAQTPESAEARWELAFALFQADRLAPSITQLERVLQLDPRHEAARPLLERARRRLAASSGQRP